MSRFASRLISLSFVILVFLLVSGVVLAATWEYRFPITVKDTSSTTRNYYPILLGQGGQQLVNMGYINANGLDTNMQIASTDIKYMMAASKIAAVIPNLPSGGMATANLYTGYALAQTNFPIIVGDSASGVSGYVGMPYDAGLEQGNNFEIDQKGYVDTSAGVDKNLMLKPSCFRTYVSGATNITSAILTPAAPTTMNLLPNGVGNYTNIQIQFPATTYHWDKVDDPVGAPDDDATYVANNASAGTPKYDTYTLQDGTLSVNDIVNSVTVYFRIKVSDAAWTVKATPRIRLNGVDVTGTQVTWTGDTLYHNYSETLSRPGGGFWSPGDIINLEAGVGLDNAGAGMGSRCTQVYVVVNYTPVAVSKQVTVTGVSSGIRRVVTTSTGGGANLLTLSVYDDAGAHVGNSPQSVALAGATVPVDATRDYILDYNNVMPYMDYYKHTVGALVTRYEPDTMILGQTYSTGTATFTNLSTNVTGAGTTWTTLMNGSMIKSNTDNVWHVVSSVTDATHLTLTANYSAGGGAGHNYTMAPRVPDREVAANDGVITWGTNTSITLIYGEMASYADTEASPSAVGGFTMPSAFLPSTWFANCENCASLPFYDLFNETSASTGIPVQTLYFIPIVGGSLAAALGVVMLSRSALLGALVLVIGLFIGSSQTVVPMWIPAIILIVEIGILYLYRQVSY